MLNSSCPCGRAADYAACCGRYISGAMQPLTAEQLMRSRYTAFTQSHSAYLTSTLLPTKRSGFDAVATAAWASSVKWLGLTIHDKTAGGPKDSFGTVSFQARYEEVGTLKSIEECSQFRRRDGRWYYVKALPRS